MRVLLACLLLVPWLSSRAQGLAPEDLPAELEAEGPDPDFQRVANPAFPSPEIRSVPVDRGPPVERSDLALYFSEGRPAEARAAYLAGKYDRARTLLDDLADTSPIRYLRALSAQRAKDHAFAAKEFEALAAVYGSLGDRCLVLSGHSYEALKDFEGAARVYQAVSADSRMAVDGKLGLARARLRRKDRAGALEALGGLPDRPPPPWGRDVGAEALLVASEVHAAAGRRAEATAALQRLWADHPMSRQATSIQAQLGDTARLPVAIVVARADALVDAHRNAPGLALVEPLLAGLKLPSDEACRAHFAAGKAQRKLRNHTRAVPLLQSVVKQCRDPELRVRAMYTLGFSQMIVSWPQATRTYEALAEEFSGHKLADDALFLAAEVHLRHGQRAEGLALLLKLVERYPDGDQAADALFALFWAHRDAAQFDQAMLLLQEIEGRYAASADSAARERARYWRAKTLAQAGRRDEAVAVFTQVATQHPATYYGLLSREHAAALNPDAAAALAGQVKAWAGTAESFPMHAGPLESDPQFKSAVELLRLGLGESVPLEVLAIDRTELPAESIRLLVHILALSGEQRAAHGLARIWLRSELSGRITERNRGVWEIAYPQAFRDLVVTHTAANEGLDPDVLQALMREESALDPKALSWAGALGLCQLMPATAAQVAGELKLGRPARADLLEPSLNIRLGAKYLGDLLRRQKGVKQYALASYNAGESAVGRWRREHPGDDIDAWVENIPLHETRGYVKRVLRSYNTYKLLYDPAVLPSSGPTPRALPASEKG